MIFKTITNSSDHSQKTIGIFNKDWNTYKTDWENASGLGDKIKSIFNSPLKELSEDQIKLIRHWNNEISKGSISQETFNQLLADADEVTQNYFKNLNGGRASVEGLTTAQNATKTSTVGLTLATSALNMAMSMGLSALVSLIVNGYDKLVNSVRNTKANVDDLMSSYNSSLDSANNNATRAEELANTYEQLSKGVNGLGENISLTTEEYKEYNSVVNKIAKMFPSLVQGHTVEGNAILSLKGNVDQLRDAYKAAKKEAYGLLITSGETSDGNDVIKQWQNINNPGFWAGVLDLGADDVNGGISVSDAIKQLEAIQNITAERYREIETVIGSGSSEKINDLSDIEKDIGYSSYLYKELGLNINSSDEEFKATQNKAKILVQSFKLEVESALSDMESLATAYLMTNEDYEKLDDQSKTIVSILMNSLDADIANRFDSKDAVGIYVDNIIQVISSNTDAQNALKELFSLDLSNISINDLNSYVDKYIPKIADCLVEDSEALKIRLGFDFPDTDSQISDVQKLLDTRYANRVEELSLGDLKIASEELEIDSSIHLSWDELLQKIQEVKLSKLDVSFDSQNFSNEISKITSAYGILSSAAAEYNKNGSYSLETLNKLLGLGPEYLSLLIDENGQYSVNEQGLRNIAQAQLEKAQSEIYAAGISRINALAQEQAGNAATTAGSKMLDSTTEIDSQSESYNRNTLEAVANAAVKDGVNQEEVNAIIEETENQIIALQNTVKGLTFNVNGTTESFNSMGTSAKETSNAIDDLTSSLEAQKSALEEQKQYYDDVAEAINWFYDKQIDKTEDLIENLEKENELLQGQLDGYDSALSAIDRFYQKEIDAIQEKIDAMDEANKAAERELALEKAKEELQNARNNRTVLQYQKGVGFVYTTDEKAIKEAEENLADAEQDIVRAGLEAEIAQLEQYRQLWADIPNIKKQAEEDAMMVQLLGNEWESILLTGRIENVTAFKDQYTALQTEINSNEQLIASYEEKIAYYESLKQEWDNLLSKYEEDTYIQLLITEFGKNYERELLNGRTISWQQFAENYAHIKDELDKVTQEIEKIAAQAETYASRISTAASSAKNDLNSLAASTVPQAYTSAPEHAANNGYAIYSSTGDIISHQNNLPIQDTIFFKRMQEIGFTPHFTLSPAVSSFSAPETSHGSILQFYGDLSFPNIHTENDAKLLIQELSALSQKVEQHVRRRS